MIKASNIWEQRLNDFFLKAKNFSFPQESSLQGDGLAADDALSDALMAAQNKVFDALCDSFNTPTVMVAIAELVTRLNTAGSSDPSSATVECIARSITSIVNILGLNGTAGPDSPNIGWSGVDIPDHAEPYLNAISAIRDALSQLAKSIAPTSPEMFDDIPAVKTACGLPVSDTPRPYADFPADIKGRAAALIGADARTGSPSGAKRILTLCDHIQDVDLFDSGFCPRRTGKRTRNSAPSHPDGPNAPRRC